MQDGHYSVVGHGGGDTDLYVVDFTLTRSDYQCEIAMTYGSFTHTAGYAADKDGVIESITFK